MAGINDIKKGSAIMVFLDDEAIAFSSSDSLQKNTNVVEIANKDFGDTPGVVSNGLNWTITCEDMYSIGGYAKISKAQAEGRQVQLKFGALSNYAGYGESQEPGLYPNGATSAAKTWSMGADYEYGAAIVESLQVTAQYGSEATFTATFRGSGVLQGAGQFAAGATSTPGATGVQS